MILNTLYYYNYVRHGKTTTKIFLSESYGLKMPSRCKKRTQTNPNNDTGHHKSKKAEKQMKIDSYLPTAETTQNVSNRSTALGSSQPPRNMNEQKPVTNRCSALQSFNTNHFPQQGGSADSLLEQVSVTPSSTYCINFAEKLNSLYYSS